MRFWHVVVTRLNRGILRRAAIFIDPFFTPSGHLVRFRVYFSAFGASFCNNVLESVFTIPRLNLASRSDDGSRRRRDADQSGKGSDAAKTFMRVSLRYAATGGSREQTKNTEKNRTKKRKRAIQ